jgi:hypothetical protein
LRQASFIFLYSITLTTASGSVTEPGMTGTVLDVEMLTNGNITPTNRQVSVVDCGSRDGQLAIP